MKAVALALAVFAVVAAGCSPAQSGDELEGRVTAATGLSELEAFVLTGDAGGSTQLSPADGFNRSLDEMRDLVVSGETVFVEYEVAESGERVAVSLEEAWRR